MKSTYEAKSITEGILKLISRNVKHGGMRIIDVKNQMGPSYSYSIVSSTINSLAKQGKLVRVDRGKYLPTAKSQLETPSKQTEIKQDDAEIVNNRRVYFQDGKLVSEPLGEKQSDEEQSQLSAVEKFNKRFNRSPRNQHQDEKPTDEIKSIEKPQPQVQDLADINATVNNKLKQLLAETEISVDDFIEMDSEAQAQYRKIRKQLQDLTK